MNFAIVKSIYGHSDCKMGTVCLFINKLWRPLTEMHGEIWLEFCIGSTYISKATIDFDQFFLDELKFVSVGSSEYSGARNDSR